MSIVIPVSTVPAVQAYLLDQITAATSSTPDDALVISFGEPAKNAPDIIIEVSSNVRLSNVPSTFIGSGGADWLNEVYDLDIKVSAAGETTDAQGDLGLSQTAWTYVANISTLVRSDPSLGDLVNQAFPSTISGGEVVWADNEIGRICELTVAIHCEVLN